MRANVQWVSGEAKLQFALFALSATVVGDSCQVSEDQLTSEDGLLLKNCATLCRSFVKSAVEAPCKVFDRSLFEFLRREPRKCFA